MKGRRGDPGKKAPTDQSPRSHENDSHERCTTRFPRLVQQGRLQDGRARPTPQEPRRHVSTALTPVMPRLVLRPQVTNSPTSTVTQGAPPLARNGVSHSNLRANLAPMDPASGGRLRCSAAAAPAAHMAQSGPSGSMLGITGIACPRPLDQVKLKPLPPADKRNQGSNTACQEPSRPKRPTTGERRPDIRLTAHITVSRKVIHPQESSQATLSTRARNVPQMPFSPSWITPAPSTSSLGSYGRSDSDFGYESAGSDECMNFIEERSYSVNALWTEYLARCEPQQPPPQSPPSSSPAPYRVPYVPPPRLLTRRPQMERRVLRPAEESSRQTPAMSLDESMVRDRCAEEWRRTLRQAAELQARAQAGELQRVILSSLRETEHQRALISRHGRTQRFTTRVRHGIVLEPRVGLETLRRNARDSRRTRGPLHRRRRRITLALARPRPFRLRTRMPIFTHRVVLNDEDLNMQDNMD